jgi:hypothetical protein
VFYDKLAYANGAILAPGLQNPLYPSSSHSTFFLIIPAISQDTLWPSLKKIAPNPYFSALKIASISLISIKIPSSVG